MTTPVRVDELIGAVRKSHTTASAMIGEAVAKRDAARAAAEQIEAARAEAEQIEADARRAGGAQLLEAMRRLTDEVRQARETAAMAIRTGQQPLECWLVYRSCRATNRGTWQALREEYQRISGFPRSPAGDWGPDVIAQYDPGLPEQIPVETFTDFLSAVTHELESQLFAASARATREQIEAAHAAATTGEQIEAAHAAATTGEPQ